MTRRHAGASSRFHGRPSYAVSPGELTDAMAKAGFCPRRLALV